ncbi:hypothetical protein FV139_07020 [Parahaliea maris]|uniref:Phosphohistidine phosphatase SixA n=1 Tax=Parahaliea maris TaxID=2716870 RepID=A0A5C9A417_9GAMM|nr:hypothetical protein [Parahaliea maris]TXS95623.1 hypothetical protein FV139_07020 [Parahaliea maris]
MILTIWRHGEAAPAVNDRLRQLTPRGERDVARGAPALADLCQRRGVPAPDQLWFSEWQRTTQTAGLIATALACDKRAERALIPGASVAGVEHALAPLFAAADGPAHLVLVSHQPLVSSLVDVLLGEHRAAPPHPPGGLVTLELSAPAAACGRLLWWAFPPDFEAGA